MIIDSHTVKAAALQLGVSEQAVRRWVFERKLSHVRLGRLIRIPQKAIDDFVARGTVAALSDE